jgi:DNA-directed RNA polymerase specialized sigma subunit
LVDAAPVATAEASPEDLAAKAQLEAVVAAAQRAVLTERQAQVLAFRRQGMTQKQTGEAMGGLRQPSVMQHERRAIEKLRQAVVAMPRRPALGARLPLRPPLAA